MSSSMTISLVLFRSAGLAAGLLALAGCESDPVRGRHGAGTGGAPMTASGELARVDPPPMEGRASFLAERLTAEALLGKSDVAWSQPEGPSRGGRGGAGFSGGRGGGGRRGGPRGGGEGSGATPSSGSAQPARGPAIRASNAPAVQLRLRLTNHGEAPLEAEVLDFNSQLGNFVVQPAKLTLPPGEPVEAEPMLSRLGVPAVEEIPVTVRLRVGGKTGPVETQVLRLRPRAEPPASAGDSPSAAAK